MAKKEEFKCLVCGERFKTDQKLWLQFNEELKKVNDPMQVKTKIKCPKCKNDKVQHFVKNRVNVFKKIYNSLITLFDFITTQLGIIVAELFIVLKYQWTTNFNTALENVVVFFALIYGIKYASTFLNIDMLYSMILISLFFLLRKIIHIKGR